jgi:hypothetical protein
MAKDQKPADQPSGIAEQAMEQARRAADTYCDYVKQAIAPRRQVETNLLKGSRATRRRISP